jgi:hypothetical protein
MNHNCLGTIGHGSFSVASNSSKEPERCNRVPHAHFNEIDLQYMQDDTRSSDRLSGKDSSMMAPPRPGQSKGSVSKKSKNYGHRFSSKRSNSQSAARDFAKQYLAAKRLSGTISTTSSSAFLSSDSFSEEFPEASATEEEGTPAVDSSKTKWQKPCSFEEKEDEDASSSKFSVSEMKRMVMQSLPPEIRERVPPSAWKRIFSDDDTLVSDQSPLVKRLRGGSRDDVSDIVSVISNIVSRRSADASVVSNVSGLTRDDLQSSRTFQSPPLRKKAAVVKNKPRVVSNVPGHLTVIQDDDVPVPTLISTPSSRGKLAAPLSSPNSTQGKPPRVRFDKVLVRNYGSILTINPAVTAGPAVGLGWEFDSKKDETYSVGDFETSKARSGPRRSSDELTIGRQDREQLLLSLGYSQKEIADFVRQTIRIKNQRKQTVQNLNLLPMEEILEKASRKVKRVLRFTAGRCNKNKFNPEFYQQQHIVVASGAA